MLYIGVARTDITPTTRVWLTGYGNRDHRSEGVYQALRAGALSLADQAGEVLILTADLIGYDLEYAAGARMAIGAATGLLPHQIVLTATHTHCGPFFFPWAMPGQVEWEYARFLRDELVRLAVAARSRRQAGTLLFSRGRSRFGVSRRLPDGQGGMRFAPNPDGSMDRDLDTLWLRDRNGALLGTLTVYACHPTSLGGYLIGADYPGFLCRALEAQTGAPALFATGCGGDARPWFKAADQGFGQPTLAELEAAGGDLAAEVLASQPHARPVAGGDLRVVSAFHSLPYAERPSAAALAAQADSDPNPLLRQWARAMLDLATAGGLPSSCPQEIQVLQFAPDLRAVFLGGEILSAIGLRLKEVLQPATTVVVGYSNGLTAYVPGAETYDLGGYEVDGNHYYYLRPAPFARDAEDRIVEKTIQLAKNLT